MPKVPSSLALLAVALLSSSAAAAAPELPFDPNICVTPVESGEPGAPPYAKIPSHDWPQFIPGHPTPIFHGDWQASYIDGAGRVRRHPGGGPHILDDFFLGSDGDVYWWPWSRSDLRFVFDRYLGYFRPLRPDETERHRQVEKFLAEIAAVPAPDDAPSYMNWGVVSPTRQHQASHDTKDPDYYMTQPKWAETPHFWLRVETEDDVLRLAWDGRSREVRLPRVGVGNWNLTELERSEQVLYHGDAGLILIDRELGLTRPDGDWRLGSSLTSDVIYLPETGEAMVTNNYALPYWKSLFWLRDRRLSGRGICGDTAPPPASEAWRSVPLAGTEVIDTEHMGDVEPVWTGRAFLVGGQNGAFEVPLDGPARRLEEVPAGYSGVARLPYSDLIVIASCDRFFLYDGDRFTYASGDLTWFFDDDCIVRDFTPVGRDGAGSVQLSRWKLTRSGRLERSDGAFAGDVDWDTWLRSEPNPAQWPGAESYPNGRLMKSWDKPDWWKLPRFGFAMRYGDGRFVRLGPDLAPTAAPGESTNRNWLLHGIALRNGINLLFDPGRGDALAVDSGERLVRIAADGTASAVPCPAPCELGVITTLDNHPANPSGALIGTEAGMFRYAPGRPLERLLPVALTGPVISIQTIPWLGESLVEGAFGRFVWSDVKETRWLGASGGPYHPLQLFLEPERRLMFTKGRIPRHFELLGGAGGTR
jgi:hypothetical protein